MILFFMNNPVFCPTNSFYLISLGQNITSFNVGQSGAAENLRYRRFKLIKNKICGAVALCTLGSVLLIVGIYWAAIGEICGIDYAWLSFSLHHVDTHPMSLVVATAWLILCSFSTHLFNRFFHSLCRLSPINQTVEGTCLSCWSDSSHWYQAPTVHTRYVGINSLYWCII